MQEKSAAQRPDSASGRKGRLLLRLLPLAVLAAAFAGLMYAGAGKYLSFDYFLQSRDGLAAQVRAHFGLSLVVYFAIYAGAVALSIPGALLLTIAGGFLFGGLVGAMTTTLAAATGATLLFLIARSSLGETLARRCGPRLEKLRAGFRDDAVSYMLFLRLVPVFPFWLVNLAPALLGVPLATFVWTTLVGILPGTIAYSLAGAGLDSVIVAQKAAHDLCLASGKAACKLELSPAALVTRELVLAFAAIGLAALLPVVFKRWRNRSRARAAAGKQA